MIRKRCKWPVAVLLLSQAPVFASALPEVHLAAAKNLQVDGRQSEAACIPLLLEFAAVSCEYCQLLEEEILKPILRNRDYDSRVLMRRVVVDAGSTLRGFDGKQVVARDLAHRYSVFVTPTLLFTDGSGNEIAERMVGVNTLEMYGGYLDQALDASVRKLRDSNPDCR